jgi:hypothetical protein
LDDEQFGTLLDKLDKILRLQALDVVKTLPKEQDKIEQLDAAGFKPAEIDRLLGKTSGYSNVVLGRLKEKKQPKTPAPTVSAPNTTAPPTTASTQQEVLTA